MIPTRPILRRDFISEGRKKLQSFLKGRFRRNISSPVSRVQLPREGALPAGTEGARGDAFNSFQAKDWRLATWRGYEKRCRIGICEMPFSRLSETARSVEHSSDRVADTEGLILGRPRLQPEDLDRAWAHRATAPVCSSQQIPVIRGHLRVRKLMSSASSAAGLRACLRLFP
jgi:hypothetical protein